MYFRKEQIIQKINEISQERHSHDKLFMDLQQMIAHNKKSDIVDLRKRFSFNIEQLHKIVKDNQSVVELLAYRVQKLSKQGIDLNNQKIRIQSLKEYFSELHQKVKRQAQRGQQIITGRERWQLIKYQGETTKQDQQQSLLNSHSAAKQTTQLARTVLQSISNQGNRLEGARQKMGNVLKNINFSGNLAQLIRTRTRQDNRLIAMLSLGLAIWILVCLFVLKPLYRGS